MTAGEDHHQFNRPAEIRLSSERMLRKDCDLKGSGANKKSLAVTVKELGAKTN
jgi:hypothetical protein